MNEPPQREPPDSDEKVHLVPVPAKVSFVQLRESLDDIEDSATDVALFFWILGLLFFGLGDTISSFLVFSKGGVELNPVMQWALGLPGGLLGFVFVKSVALAVLYATAYFFEGFHRWMIPLLMTIAGVYLTTTNMMAYMGLSR
ncbi:MAG: hypothetical protein HY681_09255 [Chloroflexi bacterium]|nr:hypothetical protein [Chloroflexota bacterium]